MVPFTFRNLVLGKLEWELQGFALLALVPPMFFVLILSAIFLHAEQILWEEKILPADGRPFLLARSPEQNFFRYELRT